MAELVTALEPAAAPAATIEDLTAGPASAETVPPEPVPEPEPPPTEPVTVAPTSPPPAQPAPVEQEPREPAEPPPVERLVEVLEPPAAPATTAEDAATETPAPPDPTVAPGRALASHEQHAVRRRLSSWTGRLSPEEPDATLTWREDGQEYTAVLRKAPAAADAMGMEQLAIELTTERNGERLVTELRMNRVAFSNFAQFIDRWDPRSGDPRRPHRWTLPLQQRDPCEPRSPRATGVQRQGDARRRRRAHGRAGRSEPADDVPRRHRNARAAHRVAAARRDLRTRRRSRRASAAFRRATR